MLFQSETPVLDTSKKKKTVAAACILNFSSCYFNTISISTISDVGLDF